LPRTRSGRHSDRHAHHRSECVAYFWTYANRRYRDGPNQNDRNNVDFTRSYVDFTRSYVDFTRSYVDFTRSHVDFTRSHVDFTRSHVDFTRSHVDFTRSHVDFTRSHVDIARRWNRRKPHAHGRERAASPTLTR
jgi:hypothetical protein